MEDIISSYYIRSYIRRHQFTPQLIVSGVFSTHQFTPQLMVFSGDTTSPTGISFLPPYLAVRHRIMPFSSQNCCMRYLPRTQFSPLLLPFYSTSLCSPFHNSPVFLPRTQFSPLLPTFFPTSLCFPFHSKHIFPSIT